MDTLSGLVLEDKRINPAEKLINVYQGRLPADIKDVFKVARALIVGNDIVQPVISKMAEAPVTKLNIKGKGDEGSDADSEEALSDIFEKRLKIKSHLLALSYDNYGYSNAFSSVYFAPRRYLKCPYCVEKMKREKNEKKRKTMKARWPAKNLTWTIKIEKASRTAKLDTINFYGNCPQCKAVGIKFIREDKIYHNAKSLRLIRWDPYNMEIDHYRELGRSEYYYTFPKETREKIRKGERVMLTEYPWPIIESAINNRTLHIDPKGFYHFKLESISGVYDGWGVPRILSVLTALYTVLSMVKANEATSEGRINDLTIISPQQRGRYGSNEDPIQTIGLTSWLEQTKNAINQFRKDKTITAFLPFPVQSENIYGNGRAQLISGELNIYIRNILAALGLPEDVIYSGGSYTSIAVAARLLANQADDMRKQYNLYLTFIKDTISRSLSEADYSHLTVSLEPYESADDFQKTNMQIQMALSGRYPWTPIYRKFGMSFEEVIADMEKEAKEFGRIQKETAEAEGRSLATSAGIQEYLRMGMAKEMMRYNAMEQKALQIKASEDPSQKPLLAQQMAEQIAESYPVEMWEEVVQSLSQQDLELAQMIMDHLNTIKNEGGKNRNENGMIGSDRGEKIDITQSGPGMGSSITAMKSIAAATKETEKAPARSQAKL